MIDADQAEAVVEAVIDAATDLSDALPSTLDVSVYSALAALTRAISHLVDVVTDD